MKVTPLVLLALIGALGFLLGAEAVSGSTIAAKARSFRGSTRWSYAGYFRLLFPWNSNKCNAFVAYVLEEVGVDVPHRHWYNWSPIGAGEWGNPSSTYLTNAPCWSRRSSQGIGYVAGDGVHVGIVTGPDQTTSANSQQVVTNDWGFRSYQVGTITFWEYTC